MNMYELCYQIKQIPDLTLGKYDFLSERGVDGVIKLHNNFLLQFHEKSRISNITIHVLYIYSVKAPVGDKIKLFFILKGEKEKLENIDMLIHGSTLSEYFEFSFSYLKNITDGELETEFENKKNSTDYDAQSFIQNTSYPNCCFLTKEEVFFSGGDGKTYYNVPVWKSTEKGRLYEMLRMMHSLRQDCAFRVDLLAVKKNRTLRKTLTSGPIPDLHALQNSSNKDRDYGADTVLRSYDELLSELDSAPHFQANIMAFSNNKENSSILLASATSEAIDEGDYHISSFENDFSAISFLDGKECTFFSSDNHKLVYDGKTTSIISAELDNSSSKVLRYLTTLFTYKEISSFVRFPCLYDGENIQMRKETVAPTVSSDNALYLGKDENGYEVYFPVKLLPKHAFVSGVPGSGKTNTMHHLTYSLWNSKEKIPFLVLEPAKREYRTLCNREGMEDVMLFSPGSDMSFPLHINPFEMPKGISVSEHIRTLCEVFEGAFPLENPMPFLLDNAIEAVYKAKGWRPEDKRTATSNKEFPTMSMLYKKLEEELEQTTYSGEVKGNLESALKVRIGSLLRREMGDVFDVGKSSLTPEEWLTTPAIVELESMGRGLANFMTLMLCSLIRECLKVNSTYDKNKTRHVIFIEEAHNLIGEDSEERSGNDANPKTAATAFIVKMLAEVRALRESVFIADQLPTAMAEEVIKNTGLKIALRLTAMDDRQLLCNSMSANSSQIEDMGNFKVGEALISYEGLQRPFKMRIKEYCGEINDKKLKKELTTPKSDEELLSFFKNNATFKKNIERSIKIEYNKLLTQFQELYNREENLMRIIDRFNELEREYETQMKTLIDLNNKHEEITLKYGNDTYQMENGPELLECQKTIDALYPALTEVNVESNEILTSFEFRHASELIGEFLEFALKCIFKRMHFKRLGVFCDEMQEQILDRDFNCPDIDLTTKAYYSMRKDFIIGSVRICGTIYNRMILITPMSEKTKGTIKKFIRDYNVPFEMKFIDEEKNRIFMGG